MNQAAGFNRCVSEVQECMAQSLTCLQSNFSKVKTQKEVTHAVRDIKDYLAFHQNILIAMGTSLQHLADSLFVNMANLILLRRESSLEHVKPGVKPDTWNQLRNAPLFGYGLFPDDMICIAEQDITKFEASSAAPRPSPGAIQHTGWRGQNRFQPSTYHCTSGVGHIAGLHRRILPHPHPSQVLQVHEVLSEKANIPVHCPSFWSDHSSI